MRWIGKCSIIFLLAGIFLIFLGAYLHPILLWMGTGFILTGCVVLSWWSTVTFHWKCTKCGNLFTINWFQNLKGMNRGLHNKILFCPFCKKYTECNGEKRS